jgi:predicted ATP-binding protein involved in virulence
LSSGQKEIIATLFLIWYQTRNKPGIVLIDEPELHLNPEWHRDFIRQLGRIAPNNQYIIATHSEDIFASVDKDRRFLLQGTAGDRI